MATATDVNAVTAGRLEDFPPLAPFMMVGLIGTVVGLVLLAIAHLRSGAAPRWTGPVLLAFVVGEFIGSNVSQWATYLSGPLLLGACAGLIVTLVRGARPLPRRRDPT